MNTILFYCKKYYITHCDTLSYVWFIIRNVTAAIENLRKRRGSITVGRVARVSVRPAPHTACLCLRGAGAGPPLECVMHVTDREERHMLDRVRNVFRPRKLASCLYHTS